MYFVFHSLVAIMYSLQPDKCGPVYEWRRSAEERSTKEL